MFLYTKENSAHARDMRKNMTEHERKLWYEFLREIPYKFYRQRTIGNFIVDFYCADKKIAIEIDGSQHYDDEEIKYDRARTAYLHSLGIVVLRYTNLEIDRDFDSVCEDIYNHLEKKV